MDLRHYFRKVRELEETLAEDFPMVVSRETAEGGKAGRVCEVSRAVAAKLIVEGKAEMASEEQRASYSLIQQEAKMAAERAELARRVQVAIVADTDLTASSMNRKK